MKIFKKIFFYSLFLLVQIQSIFCFPSSEEEQSSSLPLTTPLHNATSYEDIAEVKLLIAKNEDLTARNKDLWTPIHVAAERRNPQLHKIIFEALKERDSSNWHDALRAQNSEQNTPFYVAVSRGNLAFLEEVYRQGIPQGIIKAVIGKDGNTLVHTAAVAGQVDILRFLLGNCPQEERAYYFNAKNVKSLSSFDLAIEGGNQVLIKAFLERDDKKELDIASALDKAIDARNTKVIIMLQKILKTWPGYTFAQHHLGEIYENGQRIPKSIEKAVKWYKFSAKQGYPRAQCELGLMYAGGRGIPKSEEESLKWYELAASQGHAPALHKLSEKNKKSENDYELSTDDAQPITCIQQGSAQGFMESSRHLDMQGESSKNSPEDEEKAIGYDQDTVSQNQVPGFRVNYENNYDVENESAESIGWYRSVAVQSYIFAQNAFCWLYGT